MSGIYVCDTLPEERARNIKFINNRTSRIRRPKNRHGY